MDEQFVELAWPEPEIAMITITPGAVVKCSRPGCVGPVGGSTERGGRPPCG